MADTVDDVILRLPGQQACRASIRVSAARVTWPPAGSKARTRRSDTRLNMPRSSRTVVPLPVPRLMAVAGSGRLSNQVSAATCAVARGLNVPDTSSYQPPNGPRACRFQAARPPQRMAGCSTYLEGILRASYNAS